MPYDPLNLGAAANDKTGDRWRSGGEKINTMFSELFTSVDALTAAPPIYLNSRQDCLDNGTLSAGEITLNKSAYLIGVIDLGSDDLVVVGGTVLIGTSSDLSFITSSSSNATVVCKNGGFVACGIVGQAGIKINNSGTGASVRVQDSGTIAFVRNLFTNQGTSGIEIENATGFGLTNYTIVNGVNGITMTGAANTGPIIDGFNPISATGKGIDIQGDIISGALRIRDANITTDGISVDITGDIIGMEFDGDAISQNSNAFRVTGAVSGGGLFTKTNILSYGDDAMNITGSLWSSLIMEAAGVTAIAAGKFGLVGDAASANITSAGIVATSFISGIGAGGGALSGITKKDLKWSFIKAGPSIVDSRNIGAMRLDTGGTTTISYQGYDGSITAYADAGAGSTTVTSTAHSITAGASVAIFGTTAYNGIFTASNITANTFDIVRTFVTDEAAGSYESGWVKLVCTTIAGDTIERFDMPANNELRSLDSKNLPVTYSVTVSGSKTGSTAEQYQFGLFVDDGTGSGFVKENGSLIGDFTNRGGSLSGRIPFEICENCSISTYIRNVDNNSDFDLIGFSVDVGLS